MAGGRPTKYDESWPKKLEDAMAKGYTVEMFCHETRISDPTFYEWVKKYPEFSNAFTAGRKDAEGFHQHYLVKNFENKSFQVAAFKLFMHNCFGWKDKKETDMALSQKEETTRAVKQVKDLYV